MNRWSKSGALQRLFEALQTEGIINIRMEAVCLDSTNADEIERALAVVKDPQNCFINSTGKDEPRFSRMTDLALKYGCNLIALTIDDETGIPKTADGRVEIAFEIYEKCMEKGISAEKLYFDPLVLPLNVAQEQAVEVLNTISMLKSCFDPPVNTIIGLSNISNGVPAHLRLVINRAFAMLALDAGLDSAIIDAKDTELVRLIKTPQKPDEDSPIVRALFNKEIYSNSLISTQDSPLGA